jgi:alpha-tubulin suppressor-like RCC1 family protein
MPLVDVVEVALGDASTCARDSGGLVWCWGSNGDGQLADGTITFRTTAAEALIAAASPLAGVMAIDMGSRHVCGQQADGSVWCWGRNNAGQVGNGATVDQPFAVSILVADSFDVGRRHTCAVQTDNTLSCWGEGWRGRLGDGDLMGASKSVPTPVLDAIGGSPFSATSVAAGGVSCAITSDEHVSCWGNNQYGQTGNGAGAYTPMPVLSVDGAPFVGAERLVASFGRVCSHMTDGALLCWGRNSEGQLGDGTTINRGNPVPLTLTCP